MENKYSSQQANQRMEYRDEAARQRTVDGFSRTKRENLQKEFVECDKKIDSLKKEKGELEARTAKCENKQQKRENQKMIKEKDDEIKATQDKQKEIGEKIDALDKSEKQSEQRTR